MRDLPLNNHQNLGKLLSWGAGILFFTTLLYLTHDIIITNFLAYKICRADPQPKTFIKKTVEYPESIYWEDNIYPGFDENDRLLMIRNYLDGVHLKTIGLNAPDGSVFIYTAEPDDWQASRDIKTGKKKGNYFDVLEQESKAISVKGQHLTKENLPFFHYSVVFKQISLTSFERRYLWSDEVAIRDNQENEVIGFNRRLMHRWYMLHPDIAMGNRYYYPHSMCGDEGLIRFDEEVIALHSKKLIPSKHRAFINHRIYTREVL
jgi:hypothetical protein